MFRLPWGFSLDAQDSDGFGQTSCRSGSKAHAPFRHHQSLTFPCVPHPFPNSDPCELGRYGDLLLEKAKENTELQMKHQEKTEEMAQNFQNEIVPCQSLCFKSGLQKVNEDN